MQTPKRRSEQDRLARQHTDNHLTEDAIARLRRELSTCKERRPHLAEETQRMREMGDLSENAGYHTAKAQLMRNNFRILEIEDELKHAIVIERGVSIGGRIRIGSTVTVRTGDRERTFEILGSQESSPTRGRISYSSPLGCALMDRTVGDQVTVTVNGKTTTHSIIAVQ
ncbi:MAG: GreA/GreB family elongation factor [Patescibacteria group bacterium]